MPSSSVVLVLGEDRFLARQEVESVLAERPGLEVTRLLATETTSAAVLDEVRTPTLFGTPKAVVVDEADALFEKETLGAFARYAERPVAGTLLVLRADRIDGRISEAQALKRHASVREVEPLPDWKVPNWIVARGAQLELTVAREAAEELHERIGGDTGLLNAALLRLKEQIAPRRRLDAEVVADAIEDQRSPTLFEAENALEAGDLPGVTRAIRRSFEEGLKLKGQTVTEEQGIALILLGRLHATWSRLLRFHMLRGEGLDEAAAAAKAGVSPRALKFFLERASRHTFDRLAERHGRFLEADAALKSGEGAARASILQHLVLALLRDGA